MPLLKFNQNSANARISYNVWLLLWVSIRSPPSFDTFDDKACLRYFEFCHIAFAFFFVKFIAAVFIDTTHEQWNAQGTRLTLQIWSRSSQSAFRVDRDWLILVAHLIPEFFVRTLEMVHTGKLRRMRYGNSGDAISSFSPSIYLHFRFPPCLHWQFTSS